MATRTEYWGVEESFFYPSAEDNFDMALQVTTDPLDLTSPYTFTSDTTCTYTFTDDAGNSVSCVFKIDITNEVQPVITSCPSGREMNTSERVGFVDWEKPLYMDMPGVELVTSCNTPKSPVELPWGDHDIMCHVTDPDSGWQAACRMPFKIRPISCAALAIPAHGALACDNFAFGRSCSVLCEEGYDVPRVRSRQGSTSTMKLFICGNSGLWFPQHLVPDCSETRSSRHNLPLIMYYPSPCSHHDTASTETIATKFLQIIRQSYFHDICTDNHLCTVDNVNVSCDSMTDRRRRSISDTNMEMASQREGSDMKVTMLLQVSPPNNHNRGIDGEGKGAAEILHRLAQHIHSHIQHHIMEADGPEGTMEEGEDVREEPGHQQFKPEATLLLGDISLECDRGHYLNKDLQTCVPCPAGYYLDVTSEICTPCEQGFFQDDQAQTDCKPCKNGTSTRNQGATHSDHCEGTNKRLLL
ncbi:sushi, von Willebrand factor type A, EGF and pentraxin domain-containing protein 1-like [Strongylocentrotus purpuratus]|uniref:HYR domain-containing protein n=1 Tax=Strongylocentrotus purpuratus TaxID=7668 RepID=A0A7M7P3K9_STRPU|nr:sushi, von Willebrand factor type A, EGF and pentraxin domain-containing protein 1-like [Strongylocentrotus purpuratus]